MIELLVMRHAKSDWSFGESDFNRPLNDRGIQAADRMAEWLVENDLVPEAIVSSPAARTRATSMAVVSGCSVDRTQLEFVDNLYLADAYTWLQVLAQQSASRVLICGHNPGLDDLVDFLAAEPPAVTTTGKLMTTAAIAHFQFDTEWSALTQSSGNLLSLTRPKEL